MTRKQILEAYANGQRNFDTVNLKGVDLEGVNLKGAHLYGANFEKFRLEGGSLHSFFQFSIKKGGLYPPFFSCSQNSLPIVPIQN
jgi:uncharacterized protein YjbI with pentapeptide repeats